MPRVIADRKPVPPEWVQPQIDAFEGVMIDAWDDLVGDRYTDLGPIPFAAVDKWAIRHSIDDPEEFSFLVRAVRSADRPYLAWVAEQMKPRNPPPPQERRGN